MRISCGLSNVYIDINYNLGFAKRKPMWPFSRDKSQTNWQKLVLFAVTKDTVFHPDSLRCTRTTHEAVQALYTWPCPTLPVVPPLPVRPRPVTSPTQAVGCSHPGTSPCSFLLH